MTEEQMYDLLVQNGMDPLQAKSKAPEYMQSPELIQTLLETPPTQDMADGGRVHLQEGGETDPTYQEIVDKIMESYPDDAEQDIKRREPQMEALIQAFGPQLAAALGTPLNPTLGGTNVSGQAYGAYAPTSADQNALQQQAIQQALNQAGYGTATFGDQGQFTGIQGATAANPYGTIGVDKDGRPINASGIASYQPFLNQATQAANAAQAAAAAGQGAGAAGIQQAQNLATLMGGAAGLGQNAGAQALANAQAQANLMSQAGIAGQGAGDADLAAARGFTGPQAYQQFMSPYQQEVIDTTMQDYQQELQRQQAQLGLGAGQAFGGGRFGVAQGELGAQGARGMASTLANLRQQGFGQAQQLAAQAAQQRMAAGQQAMQQAGQNVGLLGQGLAGQQSQAQNLQQQAAQNMALYGQAGQAALGGAGAAQQQAAQNVGLFAQPGQMQTGLASLQPQLAAQNIGLIGQMGTQQQQQDQARRDTSAQANKMIAFEPYDRMGFFGQQVTGLGGGYPGSTSYSTQAANTINPMMQLFGTGAALAGGIGNLASTFGFGGPR
jgi:hypothetical protein